MTRKITRRQKLDRAGLVCGLVAIATATVAFFLGVESPLPYASAICFTVAMMAFWAEAER